MERRARAECRGPVIASREPRRGGTSLKALLLGLILAASSGAIAAAQPGTPRVADQEGRRVSDLELSASGTATGWLRLSDGTRARYAEDIREISERYGVATALVEAVIRVESAFNPLAVSPKGARGLMQLMPGTASALGVRDSFDPRQNIDGGVRHLRQLMQRYPGNLSLALAAYNAGAGAVDTHRGIPPYDETRLYVKKVLQHPALAAAMKGATGQPAARTRKDAGDASTGADIVRADSASGGGRPARRIGSGPGEPMPAVPLIEEARRSSRPTLGETVGGTRADLRARSALGREPAAQALARMKRSGLLAMSPVAPTAAPDARSTSAQ